MKSASNLIKKFNKLIQTPIDSSNCNEDGESTVNLFQSDWTRILLVRSIEKPNEVQIEVESSLPKFGTAEVNKTEGVVVGNLVKEMIDQLQYLLKLQESGFTLDVIGQECLWTASKTFDCAPDENMFQLLLPP
jgi:hypothetical protein